MNDDIHLSDESRNFLLDVNARAAAAPTQQEREDICISSVATMPLELVQAMLPLLRARQAQLAAGAVHGEDGLAR